MMHCDEIQELLPWYALGKLRPEQAAEVSAHLRTCDACRGELANVVWLRNEVRDDVERTAPAKGRVWRHVATEAGIHDTAAIDVGSLMVGFHLGLNAGRRGAPVRATLRIMGRNVRIVGKKRGPECAKDETT